MIFIKATTSHLVEMMDWFTNEQQLNDWSGPNFRYPYDIASFTADLNLNTVASMVLASTDGELLAFGQYYLRLGKCHLAKLIVNPNCRGQGIAFELISHLCEIGFKQLDVEQCSLFVFPHNYSAIKAYQKFGFSVISLPDDEIVGDCLYMVMPYSADKYR